MQCQQCQHEWPDGFKFCPDCGIVIVAVQASEGSATATGRGIAQVGESNVALSGDVKGDVTIVQKQAEGVDAADLRHAYLCRLQGECGRLSLRGMDVDAGDPTRAAQPLNLAHVYIELDTTVQVPAEAGPGDVIFASLRRSLAQDGKGQPVLESHDREETRRVSALECAARFRHMVLLGDPGGGKSTFVNHLALCLATAQLEGSAAWKARYPAWPDDGWGLTPVPVALRDLGQRLPRDGGPGTAKLLWGHIENWLADRDLAEFGPHLKKALHQGEVFVLLDGLDEVPTARERALVRDVVADFAATYREARILVTCRTLSYQDERGKLPDDFAVFELAPFDEPKIDAFVNAWYGELEAMGTVPPGEADPLARRLREAMRRPDLWRLAPNPLLLTVMALVHSHKGRLPEARALLYEECVEMLLWRWEQRKLGAGREEGAKLRSLLLDAGLQTVDLKRILWRLAYQVHAQDRRDDDGPADLREDTLLRALRDLHPDRSWDWAQDVVNQVRERAGLLVERQPGVYTFPHRTFQEYLAGCHLSVERQFGRQGARLAREDTRWREVILLAVGRLVHHQGETDRPLALAAELCPAAEPTDDDGWRAAWLAGQVLLEIGLGRVRETNFGRLLQDRVRGQLAALLEAGALEPRERAEAGNVLAALGDPRFDPQVFWLPCRFRGQPEPLLGFLPVPAGEFQMGGTGRHDGSPIHPVVLGEYYIARYPVTVAQFRAFVEGSGFRPGDPDCLRDGDNLPVRWVSWYEAREYCAWLTERLRKKKSLPAELASRLHDEGWIVRLPTEAEWEKAAGWDEAAGCKREWPWGDEWDAARCNTLEGSIRTTTAVGLFPGGTSPRGALDMAGNVLEWTSSLYADYPYQRDDGREDQKDQGSRVLRGGAFGGDEYNARCAFRSNYLPDGRLGDIGFRLVVAPALPS